MMRSMWSAVAGLKTHQLEMDVIGNNIANVNTTAYKSQATGFQDVLYQTVREGTGAGERMASTNVSQVGLGSKVGSIYTNIAAQGSAVTTDNVLDLMITGPSFFIISPDIDAGLRNYSRDGSFGIDENGDLVTKSNGYYVLGVMGDGGVPTGTNNLEKLRVIDRTTARTGYDADGNEIQVMYDVMPGEATGESYMKGNIDRDDPSLVEGKNIALEVYGADGNIYTLKFNVTDAGDGEDNTYKLNIDQIVDSEGNIVNNSYDKESIILTYSKRDGRLESITPHSEYTISNNEETTNAEGIVTATRFSVGEKIGNLSFTKSVVGTDGKQYNLHFDMRRDFDENSDYTFTLRKITDSNGRDLNPSSFSSGLDELNIIGNDRPRVYEEQSFSIDYDETTGEILTINGRNAKEYTFSFGDGVNIGPVTIDLSNSSKMLATDTSYTFNFGGDAAGKLGKSLYVDFANTTNYANPNASHHSTLYAYKGNVKGMNMGYPEGDLVGISFGTDGSIHGRYSNGQTIKKGQIAVAEFANAMGLEKVGDNLYQASQNSGNAMVQDITLDGGYMNSGVLEGSNIDLAKEFTDMITTQRGFQANSRVITTSDEMLQILRGLKR